MFDITISGRIKQKKKVEQFVRDCLHHYFGNRIKRRVDIDIDMVRELEDGQVAGYCHGDKDQVNIELARHWSKDTRSNRINYYNQPWEIEAYKSEDMLVELYWNKVWENEEA